METNALYQRPEGSGNGSLSYLTVKEFLNLGYMPGRLAGWQAAACLGLEPQHIPLLIAAGLLRPLGNPPRTSQKYFARDHILALAADPKWLTRASDALVAHWARRNARKTGNRG